MDRLRFRVLSGSQRFARLFRVLNMLAIATKNHYSIIQFYRPNVLVCAPINLIADKFVRKSRKW